MTQLKTFLLALAVLAIAAPRVMAGERVTVLTSLDVTQAMVETLTENTSVKVLNVIPQGYSMEGHNAYLKKKQKAFFDAAATASAVVTVKGAWPADPLYKWARRGNLRVVNIDTTKPLDEYGAGVPLIEVEGVSSPYVWRSPANLTRMASIAADDLCRLVPNEAETIKANLQELQADLFKLRSAYENAFVELDFVDLAAFTGGYTYLTDEFGLDIHFYMLKPDFKWTESEMETVAANLKKNMVKGVICQWEPDGMALAAITKGGAVPVVLKRFVLPKESDPRVALVEWYDGNLSRLVTALKN